jgi:hypothetical protein
MTKTLARFLALTHAWKSVPRKGYVLRRPGALAVLELSEFDAGHRCRRRS